ncbi:PREDICTED: uncharacterized protein LOC109472385 [Branchiostoma belcheri]|uniref:Uncharacterized protein LOC109472385 n=1 Tax=Branchiostoma belcheri TaxID=7741 RepID=A0A6P4YTP5_BRABE|nr:PREDICTED: uncharacterized protein LOC109472385 [Branchiostoma belcheri]
MAQTTLVVLAVVMMTSPVPLQGFSTVNPGVDRKTRNPEVHETTQHLLNPFDLRRPPPSRERCPAHSHMVQCRDRLCRRTCTDPEPVCLECPLGYSCVCDEGYLWHNGVCVPRLKCEETTESEELQLEINQLARDLPQTLEELGLTSVVQHVQELKTNATEVSSSSGWWRSAHDCHCGREADFNRLGQRACDSECNSRCPGNLRRKCGGRFKMSVYKIDAVPSCEDGPRQVSPHWYQTGNTTLLQYRGEPQDRPFAFTTPALDGKTVHIQSTLENMTADIHGFPSHYPATTAEGMPDLVPDYTALLASLQAPGLRLTAGTNTVLELDQHFSIQSYPCSLEYNPAINGRGRRAVTVRIIVVSEDPYEVMVEIICY